jgi:hypothetical protein
MALIVVQAGHCHRRTGATGTGGLDGDPTEQEFAWAAAHRTAALLRTAGHQARVILADEPSDRYRGDGFVAIHCDGSTSRSARGASVGYRNGDGQRFAHAWKRAYARGGWSGFRADNYTSALAGYYGVKRAVGVGNRFAFIAEAGFLTSPADEALLSGPRGTERFARAVTEAVAEIFGGRAPSPSTPPQEDDDMNPDEFAKALESHQPTRTALDKILSGQLTRPDYQNMLRRIVREELAGGGPWLAWSGSGPVFLIDADRQTKRLIHGWGNVDMEVWLGARFDGLFQHADGRTHPQPFRVDQGWLDSIDTVEPDEAEV